MIAQDTGGAIIGPARADIYFGAGEEAGSISGRLRHPGRFVMLVPNEVRPAVTGAPVPLPRPKPSAAVASRVPVPKLRAKGAATAVDAPLPKPKASGKAVAELPLPRPKLARVETVTPTAKVAKRTRHTVRTAKRIQGKTKRRR